MTHRAPNALFALLIIATIAVNGCASKDRLYSPTEAEKKLAEFCKKEGNIDVFTRQVGRTEWIYVALAEPIFEVRAGSSPDQKETREPSPFSLLFLDGAYNVPTFSFSYDLVPDVLPQDPVGYGLGYNDNYTKKRQLIYQGLQQTFFNLAKDEETRAAAPNFFVIVAADISKGIATKNILYLDDLKASLTDAIPYDEYYMREVNSIFSDKNLIGDKTGRNLKYAEITWPFFLTEQIKTRIRFKFTQSDFPPKSDPDRAIIAIIANTMKLYPFSDFDSVDLHNLREKRDMTFSKEQLKTFEEQPLWSQDNGKLTVIKFRMPQRPDEHQHAYEDEKPHELDPDAK